MSGVGEAAEIFMWRLHYGKLASGPDLHIPATEGYGVTRRSLGLTPDDDALLSPSRLVGLRRLEPDLFDIEARASGCLAIRGDGGRVSILRSRFRHEDGEEGHGRLYQQSAVWIADAAVWRRHPAAFLALAGDVVATPDSIDEDEAARFAEAPLRYRADPIDAADVRQALEEALDQTDWALPLLQFLAEGAETGADMALTFGSADFACEQHFLAGVGAALQFLTEDYPRWGDISVVSGLRHRLPGLCLRYLPTAEAGEMEEAAAA